MITNISPEFLKYAERDVRSSSMRIKLNFDGNENIDYDMDYDAYLKSVYSAAPNYNTSNRQLKIKEEFEKCFSNWATFQVDANSKQFWDLGNSPLVPDFSEEQIKSNPDVLKSLRYGYWSNYQSNEAGSFFTGATIPKERGVMWEFKYEINLPDICILFDDGENPGQYCCDFDVIFKGIDPSEPERRIAVRDNKKYRFSLLEHDSDCVSELTQIKSLWIAPIKWSRPYEQFRMYSMSFFGSNVTFYDDDLYEVKVVESCEQDGQLTSAGLNRLNVRFNNHSGKICVPYAVPELKVDVEFAFNDLNAGGKNINKDNKNWISMGTFYATVWNFENKTVTMEATDVLELVGRKSVEHPYIEKATSGDISANDFVKNLLKSCGRNDDFIVDLRHPALAGSDTWWKTTYGNIQPNDYRSILTEVASNMASYVHVNRQNQIAIKPYDIKIADADVGRKYTKDPNRDIKKEARCLTPDKRYQGGTRISPYDTFNSVEIEYFSVYQRGTETVFSGDVKAEDGVVGNVYRKLEYTSKPCIDINYTPSAIFGQNHVVSCDYMLFNLESNKNYNVTIKGKPLVYNSRKTTFEDDYRSKYYIDFTMRFVQSDEVEKNVYNILKSRFKNRRSKYEIECRGNPALEIGDTVAFVDDDNTVKYAILTQAEYTYNGGLKARYILKGEK